jgi:hypothetical protein
MRSEWLHQKGKEAYCCGVVRSADMSLQMNVVLRVVVELFSSRIFESSWPAMAEQQAALVSESRR